MTRVVPGDTRAGVVLVLLATLSACARPSTTQEAPVAGASASHARGNVAPALRYSFGYRTAESRSDRAELFLTVHDAESRMPVRFDDGSALELPFPELEGGHAILAHPRAIGSFAGGSNEPLHRIYLLYGGRDVSTIAPAIAEVQVALDLTASPPGRITPGRTFTLPEHGKLDGAVIRADENGERLYVTIPSPQGDPALPSVYVYAIGPKSTSPDPIEILVPPR